MQFGNDRELMNTQNICSKAIVIEVITCTLQIPLNCFALNCEFECHPNLYMESQSVMETPIQITRNSRDCTSFANEHFIRIFITKTIDVNVRLRWHQQVLETNFVL